MSRRCAKVAFLNVIFVLSVATPALSADVDEPLITPTEWLARQPAPLFRDGHTLPRLTCYGWSLPFDLRVRLAEDWGYALSFSGYATSEAVENALSRPKSENGRVLALAASDSERYPLSVILSRRMPKQETSSGWLSSSDGNIVRPKRWSPAASDAALTVLAEVRAAPMRRLARVVSPQIVLNGGEYGVGVLGFSAEAFASDPKVVSDKGDRDWFTYVSQAKAREQFTIRSAVDAALPEAFHYVFYVSGGGPHRGRDLNWRHWEYDYAAMRGLSTLPSNGFYYREFNSGWLKDGSKGGLLGQGLNWLKGRRKGDLLTQALNAKGIEIAAGDRYSYDWVSGGWHGKTAGIHGGAGGAALVAGSSPRLSDIALYTGFLRCLYLAGTLGANGGYYAFPKGGFKRPFHSAAPPHWLLQLVALGRVHALFSHLEPFVRASHLEPGPDRHAWGDEPAYELANGHANVRILARRHDTASLWLMIVWAADGIERDVTASLPGFAGIPLHAAPQGRLYIIDARGGTPLATPLDEQLPVLGLSPELYRFFEPG